VSAKQMRPIWLLGWALLGLGVWLVLGSIALGLYLLAASL
jgi:hypothetical protein